tara:strand:- start:6156 stop:6380 length:225 start_codon:yes stop_codon:yes gene_type:complete
MSDDFVLSGTSSDGLSTTPYTNKQVDKAIKNMVDKWDLAKLYKFAYEEMEDYFYDRADPYDLNTLMEEHGEKEN